MRRHFIPVAALILALSGAAASAQVPASTGWTYQGKLTDNGSPATGTYDMRFSLFLDDQGTVPTGPVLDVPGVVVTSGLFSTRLDFGAQFTGYQNWMLIEISPAGLGTYTALPLQEITSSPQANFSLAPWNTDANYNISYTGGKVAIGTATPVEPLTVETPLNDYGISHRAGLITFATYLGGGGNGAYLGTATNHPLHFYANNSDPLMTVTPTRLVGIGVVNPSAKLHLYDPQSVTHLVETGGGTNSWSKSVYRNLSGSWEVGTSRNFNGDSFYIYRAGAATVALSVLPNGLTQVRTLQILGGSDLAEPFNVNAPTEPQAEVKPGMVVVIDETSPGELRLTTHPYDTKVAGIISGANGLAPGMVMRADDKEYTNGKHPVAMTGRVWCYVDAAFGAVRPGDLLTTSSTRGHAMKANDKARSGGAVIGKAMSELPEGKGLVLVLVNLQ